jgi:hypothetical protein
MLNGGSEINVQMVDGIINASDNAVNRGQPVPIGFKVGWIMNHSLEVIPCVELNIEHRSILIQTHLENYPYLQFDINSLMSRNLTITSL